jgi:hypothetical protein
MTIDGPDYDKLLNVIMDNARMILLDEPTIRDNEDQFHDVLFGRVLTEIDNLHEDLSKYEAADVSEVCGEVEGDIIHGDILGW